MSTRHPFLLAILLFAIGVRSVLGAPCCMFVAQAAEMASGAEHAGHADHSDHAGHHDHYDHHGDNPSANPCCAACGPVLPPELAVLKSPAVILDTPEPAPIRELETRPPFPAYEARGPPLKV